jgi:peroxiredoxin Q/BCP
MRSGSRSGAASDGVARFAEAVFRGAGVGASFVLGVVLLTTPTLPVSSRLGGNRERFPRSPMSTRLAVGDDAPDFTLPTADGGSVTLSELRGSSVIVYFYPAASTPGCTKEACDFRDSLASLQGAGYKVVGISPDPLPKLVKFAEEELLTFPLASDESKATLEAYGAWGEKKLYGKTVTGVIRSTVVVDPEGKVALAQYNVKATGHVAKLRRDLGIDPKK